jgi:hypothetical protein
MLFNGVFLPLISFISISEAISGEHDLDGLALQAALGAEGG